MGVRYHFDLLLLLSLSLSLPPAVFGAADHFILTQVASLAYARMDPIVQPGQVSGHVHNIMGGSAFSQDLTSFEDLQASQCSTSIVGADKSNYWAPHLYYQGTDGKVLPILNQNRIYYFLKNSNIKPFPPGFRMVSGTAMTRNASAYQSMGLAISCNHGKQTQYLPNGTTYPGGCGAIAMGIYFPSCGLADGSLDSPDHFSHMAWPQSWNGPNRKDDPNGYLCPDSHPIKYPTIFMEASYYPDERNPWHSGNPLILSNGDTLGLSYHADFHNGWDVQTITDTIAQCGNGKAPGDNLKACAPLAKTANQDAVWKCRYQNQIPDEDVGLYQPLDALPGCNPVWNADLGPNKPTCPSTPVPKFVWPDAMFVNLKFRNYLPISWIRSADLTWKTLQKYHPSIGYPGASSIKPWGDPTMDNAVNVKSLHVGTLADALAGLAGNNSTPSTTNSTSTSSISPTNTSTTINTGNAIVTTKTSSTTTSKTSSTTTTTKSSTNTTSKTSTSTTTATVKTSATTTTAKTSATTTTAKSSTTTSKSSSTTIRTSTTPGGTSVTKSTTSTTNAVSTGGTCKSRRKRGLDNDEGKVRRVHRRRRGRSTEVYF